MIKKEILCEACEKAAYAIEEMQEAFTGMSMHKDLEYNFSNKEIDLIDQVFQIIATKAINLKD